MKPSLAVAALLLLALAAPARAEMKCPDPAYPYKRMARYNAVCCTSAADGAPCKPAVSDYAPDFNPYATPLFGPPNPDTDMPSNLPKGTTNPCPLERHFYTLPIPAQYYMCCPAANSAITACTRAPGKKQIDSRGKVVDDAGFFDKAVVPPKGRTAGGTRTGTRTRTGTGNGSSEPKYCPDNRKYFRTVSGKHYCCSTPTGKTCVSAPPGTVERPAVTADAAAGKLPLTALESSTLYLTKAQWDQLTKDLADVVANDDKAKRDAAALALAAKTRSLIKANLRPDAVTRYEAASKAATKPADLDAALGEPWGGKPKDDAVGVGDSGANADLQLTQEEFKKLSAADQKAYSDARVGKNGGTADSPLDLTKYFPVDLHAMVADFRKKIPGGVVDTNKVSTGAGDTGKVYSDANLTEDELKLLTPGERAFYESVLKANPNSDQLKKHNQWLRQRIDQEKRTAPMTADELKGVNKDNFAALPDWKKRVFCGTLAKPGGTTNGAGSGSTDLDTRSDALAGLQNSAPGERKGRRNGSTTPTADPNAWAKDPCAALASSEKVAPDSAPTGKVDVPSPTGTALTGPQDTNKVKTGPDSDGKKGGKDGDPWYTSQTMKEGVKGAMLGALIGSFGGPVGALVGAVVVGAVFAGFFKLFGK